MNVPHRCKNSRQVKKVAYQAVIAFCQWTFLILSPVFHPQYLLHHTVVGKEPYALHTAIWIKVPVIEKESVIPSIVNDILYSPFSASGNRIVRFRMINAEYVVYIVRSIDFV